jgi:predicted DNA-binding transcriptional regulator AlpA
MGIDVYTLAMEYPDVVIQVKVTDLIEAAHVFAKDFASLNELKSKEKILPDTLFTKKEVMELLGISETTLWRWDAKYNYLHPVMVGAERRWRWKDISAIIEGKITDNTGNPVWSKEKNNNSGKERK